ARTIGSRPLSGRTPWPWGAESPSGAPFGQEPDQMAHDVVECIADVHTGPPKRLKLALRRPRVARDDRTSVAHALAGWSGSPGDEGDGRLGIPALDEIGRHLLVRPANFSNQHNAAGLRIIAEEVQNIHERRPDDGIAADPDAGGDAVSSLGDEIHDLVG